ncbi:hypothetical protein [Subtercola boreus]|uniref:Uncharacterized protein n=1 Tax=Subtercola boreus TaxID=120213 RepID=A0A3E0WBX3_9MICO|nr:hypothetical protein [Subtercola boreus]RFA22011.1 hypothetical protein B7R24_04805 [Subtercola boreus]RFA22191.1 hypothetical protein B7R23_04750 [Subtercola boreus]RFA28053.1 hypothetical protein B7R25_04875 [Subtercola boreus]
MGNGALIAQLADHLESYESEQPDGSVERGVAAHFGSYRARIAGPYFPVPKLKEEVGLALCEYVRSRLGEVPAASAPLTWVD